MLLLWICLVCGFSPALSTCRWDQETLRCNGDDGNVRHTPKLREIQRVEMVRVKKISFAQTDVPNLRYLAIKDSPTLSCRNFTNWMLDINVTITINDRKCKNVVVSQYTLNNNQISRISHAAGINVNSILITFFKQNHIDNKFCKIYNNPYLSEVIIYTNIRNSIEYIIKENVLLYVYKQ